ncbi:zinc finger protein 39 [Stylonychia lemnae]|uniref:Zinc finger protein 39 n=1 Tax=Stylonychia lemnae TaxID=5949 RepID=A0A078AM84_STYLE|nr:zinc finger protein 39 [Stylonychia lemnae]|eukprot:CDW83505.1 zinc finger protein 39 [Stylonychia lemnae]
MNLNNFQTFQNLTALNNNNFYNEYQLQKPEANYHELKVIYGSQRIQMLYLLDETLSQLYNKLRMMFDINPQYEIFLQEQDKGTLVYQTIEFQTGSSYYLWIKDDENSLKGRKQQTDKLQPDTLGIEEEIKEDQLSKDDGSPIMYCPFYECKKPFRHSGNLKTHIRSHTNERPFQCQFPLCGLSFITKGHLKTHMINHSNEKPFKCHICGISYSQKSRLEIHLRKHFGIKPFTCEICGNHFTEKGNLNVHMKSHKGKRDYECEICCQKFITKGHLEDHFRRHKKDRKFKCEICGSEFYRSTQLKNHQLNQMRCIKNKQLKEYEENYFSMHKNKLSNMSLFPVNDAQILQLPSMSQIAANLNIKSSNSNSGCSKSGMLQQQNNDQQMCQSQQQAQSSNLIQQKVNHQSLPTFCGNFQSQEHHQQIIQKPQVFQHQSSQLLQQQPQIIYTSQPKVQQQNINQAVVQQQNQTVFQQNSQPKVIKIISQAQYQEQNSQNQQFQPLIQIQPQCIQQAIRVEQPKYYQIQQSTNQINQQFQHQQNQQLLVQAPLIHQNQVQFIQVPQNCQLISSTNHNEYPAQQQQFIQRKYL